MISLLPGVSLLLCLVVPTLAQTAFFNGITSTVGTGFLNPYGVGADANGNVFVADSANNEIKEIMAGTGGAPAGTVNANSTVNIVGSGFNFPDGVVVDTSGNVFVADYGNSMVKEIVAVGGLVSSSSTVLTLRSDFRPCSTALDSSANLYLADCQNNLVKEIPAAGGYTTVNTLGSGFVGPTGVAVDSSGNVYVADQGGYAVKEIMAGTGGAAAGTVNSASTVTALGNFLIPADVTVDKMGNLFVGSLGDNVIFEMIAVNGSVSVSSTIITVGTGIVHPYGVFASASGAVYVADTSNSAVKEIQLGGVNLGSTSVGTAMTAAVPFLFTFNGSATLSSISVLTMGAPNLDFTDAGSGDTCLPNTAYTAGQSCTLFLQFNPTRPGFRQGMVTLNTTSGPIATASLYGVGTGPQITFSPAAQLSLGSGFFDLGGLAVDGSGNLFGADSGNQAVKEIPAGNGAPVILAPGRINYPTGVALDAEGNVFVVDFLANAVKEILAAGGYTTVLTLGSGFLQPYGIAVDGSGNVFVGDAGHNAVKEILAASQYTSVVTLATGLGSSSMYGMGSTVALDSSGNLYIASFGDGTLKEILAAGGYTTINTLATGLGEPTGVAVDAAGNVYVANYAGAPEEILAVNGSVPSSGAVVTTVGTLNQDASLSNSTGVTLDSSGNVYLATPHFATVQELAFASAPTLTFTTPTTAGTTDATDAPLSATLINDGNAPLTAMATGLSISANFSQVSGSGTPIDCSSTFTLNPGGSCNLSLDFAPDLSSAGTVNGSVLLTDNNLNAAGPGYTTQSIALIGTAVPAPTLTFAVPTHTFGDAPFTITATSNSTGALTYSVLSGPATISGSTVTLTGAGTVVLQASQAAANSYTAGTITATFVVTSATPTLTFTVPTHTFGDAPFTILATSNSTGALTYSVLSGPATISGSTVTITGTGIITLQASQAADANYVATTHTATFTVTSATPTLTFTVPNHTFGDMPFTIAATSNSTGAITYSVLSGPATISGSTVTITGAGTITLQAAQAADANYVASTHTATFTVAASIGVSSGAGSSSGAGTSVGTATVAPGGAAVFSLTFTPGGAATFPDELSFSTTGLPPGATAIFSPAIIPAGSPATPVALTLQTSATQVSSNATSSSSGSIPAIALGFLLLPLAGLKRLRRRPRLFTLMLLTTLSMGAVLGLSGCGSQSALLNSTAHSYTVQVIATDMKTGVSASSTVTLNVQ